VERREFLQQSLVAAAVSMLGSACQVRFPTAVDPQVSSLGPDGLVVFPSQHPELDKVGGILTIPVEGAPPVALVRSSDAGYEAFWMSCPHEGTTVKIRGEGFRCPNHLAQFTIDGQWVGGQRTGPLKAVPLVFDAPARMITLGKEPPVAPPPRKAMLLDVTVAQEPALTKVGGIALFGLGNGYPAALVRVGSADYVALSPICPHLGYLVDPDAKTGGFLCPGHHAAFTSRGAWTGGQVTTNLKVLVSTLDAARGVVTITIP
jgi:Rieske Fe-S protein